jgi:hypothetical protein
MKIMRRNQSRYLGLIITLLFLFAVAAGINQFWLDPSVSMLISEGGAEWIRFREPTQLRIHWSEKLTTSFRYRLNVEQTPIEAVLTLRAMKQSVVYLDGSLLFRSPEDMQKWKEPHYVDLSPFLTIGGHELRIDVLNENGHPALLAYCSSLGMRTDDTWDASNDGHRWLKALPVNEMPTLTFSKTFERTDQALWSSLPVFLLTFLFVFLCICTDRLQPNWLDKVHLSADAVRWLLLAALLVMAANNFWKLPLEMGMDHKGHLQYIQHVAQTWRIPIATEGWQMFQPPLFYFLAATVYRSFLSFFNPEIVIRILKLIPFMFGAAHVEICYRTMRYAYPTRESTQIIGTLFGGLLPMNLYMSQSLGNEPLSGFFTALIVLSACKIFSDNALSISKIQLLMGFIMGLALLTKVTAILIIPLVIIFVSLTIFEKSETTAEYFRSSIIFVFILLGVAFAVSGWYYLYNRIEMGRFFVGGWDTFREIIWWQDPGFRTPRQCYIFGEALFYPVFSSINGFWDAIYSSFWMDGFVSAYNRPPWNYDFMLSSAWLSLLPTAAIVIGSAIAVLRRKGDPQRKMLRFAFCSILIYFAAIFYIFLTVPILSSAKATYTLGLIPCFSLLASAGFEFLTCQKFIRAVIYSLFACWVVGAYAAYWAI